MKTADRDRIAQLAVDSGFPQEPLEKVIRLAEMAALVSRHPLLSRVLALKGGTALNLFDGPPPRLSVDLDFNYVGALDRQEMLDERPDVERAVEAIARELKYKIQWSREEHAGRKIFLNYTNASGGRDRIEIDLNFAHRLPLAPLWTAVMWQPASLNQPAVQLCGLAEVAAGKICAVLDRHRPRDLFDAARLPGMGAQFWTDPSFKKLVVAFTGTLDHALHTYGRARLERLRAVDITAELLPMIGGQAAVNREELIDRAWQALAPILLLDDSEREFVDRLQAGEVRLDLLFPGDSEMRERLEKWPPLQWKALNARKPRPPRKAGPGSKGNKDDTDFRDAPSPERDPDCPFCSEEMRSRMVEENNSVFAIEDGFPVTPGHVLIIPKRHASDFFAMTSQERRDAEGLLRILKERIARDDPSVSGFNVGMNCGESAGQTIMHAHIHLIPRRDGDLEHPRGGVRGVIPEKQSY